MRRVVVCFVLALGVALGGCGTVRPDKSPLPSTTQSQTPGVPGISLGALGLENGPSNVALPPGTVLRSAVDQPNVVTVFFTEPAPGQALAHLRTALPAAGFRIDADGGGSLVFTGPEWTGSYTATDGLNALTFRRA